MEYTEYDWDNKPTPTFDKLITEMSEVEGNSYDILLLQLFNQYKDEVGPWFEQSLPEHNEYFKALDYDAMEFIGPTFHKGFRQLDIVDTRGVDSKIWGLLADDTKGFWTALDNVCKERYSTDS